MISSKTPYRVSFFGGGTDYPDWYMKNGGSVLSTTIDKYCHLTVRFLPPFFSTPHRVVWSKIENIKSIYEITHPVVREVLLDLKFNDLKGVEIHHQGDLPAGSGVGSSSSFTVGLINALNSLRGNSLSKHELALNAIRMEQNILNENVGSQDQVAVAYGGFNLIKFSKEGEIDVNPLRISNSRLNELNRNLCFLYLGDDRRAAEIAGDVIQNLRKKEDQLFKMNSLVERATQLLEGEGDLDEFGYLLDENWILKKSLSTLISTDEINNVYEIAKNSGALGGKLCGAGKTGFMIFYVPSQKKEYFEKKLDDFLHVPFKFESLGSQISKIHS